MNFRTVKMLGLSLLLIVTACRHGARKVDCDAHLTPINPPTPVAAPAPKTP